MKVMMLLPFYRSENSRGKMSTEKCSWVDTAQKKRSDGVNASLCPINHHLHAACQVKSTF